MKSLTFTVKTSSAGASGKNTLRLHSPFSRISVAIKVYFEGSPFGEPFRVSVHASTGEEAHFTFTNTGSQPDEGGGEHDA